MVAALRPEEFLGGMRGCGSRFPTRGSTAVEGVIRVSGDRSSGDIFPALLGDRSWTTGDVGGFGPDGSLAILGRRDDVVLTGGQKVFPGEVEAALMLSGEFEDVAVVGLPDPEWGQVVVACHPGASRPLGSSAIEGGPLPPGALQASEALHRRYPWPRNAAGQDRPGGLLRLASGGRPRA